MDHESSVFCCFAFAVNDTNSTGNIAEPFTVTKLFRARALPSIVSVFWVIAVNARMFPLNFPAIVAELPTCQKTFDITAPSVNRTTLLAPVESVVAILKMNTSFMLPLSLRVSEVIAKVPAPDL